MSDAPRDARPTTPPPWNARESIGLAIRGFAMGCADVVPGVSGGTIAFITGIYERFIEALRSLSPAFGLLLLRGRARESLSAFKRMHWSTLAPMLTGIGLAVILMARFITRMMEQRPGETYGFFFGLILASCWAPFAAMKARRMSHVLPAVATGVLAFWVVGLHAEPRFQFVQGGPGASSALVLSEVKHADEVVAAARVAGAAELAVIDPHGHSVSLSGVVVVRLVSEDAARDWLAEREGAAIIERERASLGWIFVCGMIAISAMMLPGISGSFLLLFLGQYQNVMGAISGVMDTVATWVGAGGGGALAGARPWWSDALFLGVFVLGVVCGMATFSRVVSWLFRHAHDATMAGLAGFMIGALRQPAEAVWAATEVGPQARSDWGPPVIAGVAGVALVVALTGADHLVRARRARRAAA